MKTRTLDDDAFRKARRSANVNMKEKNKTHFRKEEEDESQVNR